MPDSCLCGCGAEVATGSKFVQTHDGKLTGLLKGIQDGEFPGSVIPPELLQAARYDMNGSTAGFSNREILQLAGRVPDITGITGKLEEMDDKLDTMITALTTMIAILQRIEGNTRPPGRNGDSR